MPLTWPQGAQWPAGFLPGVLHLRSLPPALLYPVQPLPRRAAVHHLLAPSYLCTISCDLKGGPKMQASVRQTETYSGSSMCSSSSAAQVTTLLCALHMHAGFSGVDVGLKRYPGLTGCPAKHTRRMRASRVAVIGCSPAGRRHWLELPERAHLVPVHGSACFGLRLLHRLHHAAAPHQGHPPAGARLGHCRHLRRCAGMLCACSNTRTACSCGERCALSHVPRGCICAGVQACRACSNTTSFQ